MARKKIEEYFPKNDPPVLIGGYVPLSLREKAKPILAARGLCYADVIRAALKMLVEDDSGSILKIAKGENKYGRKL